MTMLQEPDGRLHAHSLKMMGLQAQQPIQLSTKTLLTVKQPHGEALFPIPFPPDSDALK